MNAPTAFVAARAHELIQRMIRIGVVIEVAPVDGLARVQFEDTETDSPWLPWAALSAGANNWAWSPPEVGSRVGVFAPGGDTEAGFILAAFPDIANAPSGDDDQQTFKVGGLTITVKGNGDVEVAASGSLKITGAGVEVDAGALNNTVVKGLKVELNP